ncbi:MAG: MobC family plasmid mobilization relaxosome protein [Luteococcus sp.]|uniref:MobC family plasmid mobilization relaxosome protein n=1 Tax=Luteococcus sp. TaxID=1969402 RepID=UPI00264A1FDC|nr:MobC family plasmid mobilization relaxosome protein [Luteococcus sp.]MDN5564673.1 MobC family plasmid mobilization relaxosome protein [Luteococcus sp.]
MSVSPWKAPQADTPPPTRALWDVDLREVHHEERHQDAELGDEPTAAETPASDPSPVMRDKTLVVRLTREERDSWHAAAAAAGWGKTASWVRSLMNAWIEAGSTKDVLDAGRAERDQWRREFVRIGNNLNQLTRAVHVAQQSGTAVGFQVSGELERLSRETRRLRVSIEAATSR